MVNLYLENGRQPQACLWDFQKLNGKSLHDGGLLSLELGAQRFASFVNCIGSVKHGHRGRLRAHATFDIKLLKECVELLSALFRVRRQAVQRRQPTHDGRLQQEQCSTGAVLSQRRTRAVVCKAGFKIYRR